MIRSLWVAKTGMEGQQTKLDAISNNLANVATNGFKRGGVLFEDLMYQNIRPSGAATGAYWVRAFREINEDAPAVWLYEPRQVLALQVRLQPTRILPTLSLAGLADWTIPSGQRLPRDRASK